MTEKLPFIKSREIRVVHEIPLGRIQRFWEELKKGKVLATKCQRCGALYFPPASDCSKCLASNMDWVELSGEAIIKTFTYVSVRPETFQQTMPYMLAVGELKEGVRVLAWLVGVNPSNVKVGMKVKLVAKITPEGNPIYEFVPLE